MSESIKDIINLNLDIYNYQDRVLYHVQQTDHLTRILHINITNKGENYILPAGSYVEIYWCKPDYTNIIEDSLTTESGNLVLNSTTTSTVVKYTLTNTACAKTGVARFKLNFLKQNNNGTIEKIATCLGKIRIEGGVVENDKVISTNEYRAAEQIVADGRFIVSQADEAVKECIKATNNLINSTDKIITDANNYALKSKSYAVGNTGTRPNENTDCAEFYYEKAKEMIGDNIYINTNDESGYTRSDMGLGSIGVGKNAFSLAENSIVVGERSTSNTKCNALFGSYNNGYINSTNSLLAGTRLKCDTPNQAVFGVFNRQNDDALLVVGNGTNEQNRANVLEVLKNGNITSSNDIRATDGNGRYVSLLNTANKLNSVNDSVSNFDLYPRTLDYELGEPISSISIPNQILALEINDPNINIDSYELMGDGYLYIEDVSSRNLNIDLSKPFVIKIYKYHTSELLTSITATAKGFSEASINNYTQLQSCRIYKNGNNVYLVPSSYTIPKYFVSDFSANAVKAQSADKLNSSLLQIFEEGNDEEKSISINCPSFFKDDLYCKKDIKFIDKDNSVISLLEVLANVDNPGDTDTSSSQIRKYVFFEGNQSIPYNSSDEYIISVPNELLINSARCDIYYVNTNFGTIFFGKDNYGTLVSVASIPGGSGTTSSISLLNVYYTTGQFHFCGNVSWDLLQYDNSIKFNTSQDIKIQNINGIRFL